MADATAKRPDGPSRVERWMDDAALVRAWRTMRSGAWATLRRSWRGARLQTLLRRQDRRVATGLARWFDRWRGLLPPLVAGDAIVLDVRRSATLGWLSRGRSGPSDAGEDSEGTAASHPDTRPAVLAGLARTARERPGRVVGWALLILAAVVVLVGVRSPTSPATGVALAYAGVGLACTRVRWSVADLRDWRLVRALWTFVVPDER